MGSKQSIEDVLSNLEARVAFRREQEDVHAKQQALHAQQEAHHRGQQAFHKAELEKALQTLESFRTALTSAEALAPISPKAGEISLPPPNRNMAGRLVMLAVESPELEEPFGPWEVTAETNHRFQDHLRKPVGPRIASDAACSPEARSSSSAKERPMFRRSTGGSRTDNRRRCHELRVGHLDSAVSARRCVGPL
jgi:hypothetical protein